ncbi:MAG: ABC transporter permease [Beijerinckiaceae bacterium]
MLRFFLGRLAVALSVAVTLSIVTFLIMNAAVDPAAAMAGQDATEERIEQVRRELGLDRPLVTQYFGWLSGVLSGDFGQSWYWKQPVSDIIVQNAPSTILLAGLAVLVTVLVAVPLGLLAALYADSWVDRLAVSFSVGVQAMPTFFMGLLFIIVFALNLRWFPVSGEATLAHFIMPSVVLGLASVPPVMRLMRTGLLDALSSDYIRTARAKGLMPGAVIMRHAFRNALLPIVAVLALQLGQKLGGSVVTESVFAINGLGRLALQSILAADIPTVQMLVFVFALLFVTLNLLADLINAWLDPRIRVG